MRFLFTFLAPPSGSHSRSNRNPLLRCWWALEMRGTRSLTTMGCTVRTKPRGPDQDTFIRATSSWATMRPATSPATSRSLSMSKQPHESLQPLCVCSVFPLCLLVFVRLFRVGQLMDVLSSSTGGNSASRLSITPDWISVTSTHHCRVCRRRTPRRFTGPNTSLRYAYQDPTSGWTAHSFLWR